MSSERTNICPQCGFEYEPWIEICPDCGVLVESRPKGGLLAPDVDPQWSIVTNVPNSIIGSFMKSQLEDAGIPVLMFRSRSADIAEFSHNDYVPQDLLVPFNRLREARQLIDAAPGNSYGPQPWDMGYENDLEQEDSAAAREEVGEEHPGYEEPDAELPEGWSKLPTEADLHARQQVRRTHGEAVRGWYWSDERAPQSSRDTLDEWEDEYEPPYGRASQESNPYILRRPQANPYGQRGYSDEYARRQKRNRIIYGVLLLAMSLPFLLQLLGSILSTLGGIP